MNEASTPILRMCDVHKRFGATMALRGVSLEVMPGEVHALLGENGAGKSTLMKILAGAIQRDRGELTLHGRDYSPKGPLAARRAGVAMIYQELNLAPDLTVEQNVMLGAERHRLGVVRRGVHRAAVQEALRRLSREDLSCDAVVSDLSPGDRQMVEIARALVSDARVVVMDEPTSSLGLRDIEQLFAVIDRLRRQGVAIVYISHFLEEVQRVADRFTVLRDGEVAASGNMSDATIPELIGAMIGRRLDDLYPQVEHTVGDVLFELNGVSGAKLPRDASLKVRRGEIVGLAGLVGAGRTELLRALFGLDLVKDGTIRVGHWSGRSSTPHGMWSRGVGMLSEDRKGEGLALDQSIADNALLSKLRPFSRFGLLNVGAMRESMQRWITQLGIRCRESTQIIGELSGGNQQKVAIARLLHHDVDVLLLDEPTRGIDVASKAQIYKLIGELAARGKSVLLVSSYMPELLGVCDRIAVMHRGVITAERPARDWTEHELMVTATSGQAAA